MRKRTIQGVYNFLTYVYAVRLLLLLIIMAEIVDNSERLTRNDIKTVVCQSTEHVDRPVADPRGDGAGGAPLFGVK